MQLSTCLWFNGNAREAAEYYVKTFPGGKLLDNWITPADTPGNAVGEEVVVRFEILGQRFIALNGGPEFTFSEAISFEIPCVDQDEIDHYWSTLIGDGGEASVCGWLKDKFGVSWQVSSPRIDAVLSGEDKEGAKRATEAMLEMTKLDIAQLEAAYRGS